jgi:hypothetical protein
MLRSTSRVRRLTVEVDDPVPNLGGLPRRAIFCIDCERMYDDLKKITYCKVDLGNHITLGSIPWALGRSRWFANVGYETLLRRVVFGRRLRGDILVV